MFDRLDRGSHLLILLAARRLDCCTTLDGTLQDAGGERDGAVSGEYEDDAEEEEDGQGAEPASGEALGGS